ncbi:MAG TPA: flagellar hook-basal body protein [Deltaproteobacteria bacterium]|nr:flagellar hook-basal body protein [Deltaproteobacteria bacterium]
MIQDISTIVQSALSQEMKLDNIANHLANASTTGFKADILSFDEALQAHSTVDFTQGDFRETGNVLDLALSGDGFFKIQTQQGMRYTRNGTFSLNKDNILVTGNGDQVMGESGPISIQGSNVQVNENGEVFVDNSQEGKLSIVTFSSKEKLIKEGESLFKYIGEATDEIGSETALIKQGSLEMPNTILVIEMTKMVETMRTYESYMKILQTFDDVDAKLVNELGKV